MTTYFKVSFFMEGGLQILHGTAVEINDRIWLVPDWILAADGKSARPKRIIPLDRFPHQRINPPDQHGVDFAVNIPIPKALFESPIPQTLKERYGVEELPDITFYREETRH
jgi:hypothetical protein